MRSLVMLLAAVGLMSAGQFRAFWADAFHAGFRTPAEVDRMIDNLVTAKANAVLIEARHRGAVYYLKSQEPVTEDASYQKGFDALEYTIEKAHAKGIEVHLWSPVTPLWDLARMPADPKHTWNTHGPNATGQDLWLTLTQAGKMSRSIDLGHPEASRHAADVFIDALRQYNLDGIHLDYIRYPEDDRYGWNPTAIDRFNRLYARDGIPVDNDAAWSEFRRKQVTDVVRQVYLRAYEVKPSAKVSAALITWGNGPLNDAEFRTKDAYGRVFQDWPRWMEEGILDFGMPMNYFDNTRYSGYLDRWLAFENSKQFGRAIVPGLGIYLNAVPATVSQVERVMASSAGVALYSYASTNTLVNGVPQPPAAEFYRTLGEYFKEPTPAPSMPWKEAATDGHILGTLTVEGAPSLADGVDVAIQSDTRPDFVRQIATDGTGFFGSLGFVPDKYYVRLSRGGRELYRTVPIDLRAGMTARFDVFLKAEDFAAITPRVLRAANDSAAPGEVVALEVANLSVDNAVATAVPLPRSLRGVQAFVNGMPAALSAVGTGRVEVQMPMILAERWSIVVRRAGLDSPPFDRAVIAARPTIVDFRRTEWGMEVVATGLGATTPPPAVGAGGATQAPYNELVGPVTVSLNGTPLEVLWAGLEPYQPYRYQVNVRLPENVQVVGDLELTASGHRTVYRAP